MSSYVAPAPLSPATPRGLWVFSPRARHLDACPFTRACHGVGPSETLRLGLILRRYPPQARRILWQHIRLCLTEGTPFSLRLPFAPPDGSACHILLTGQRLQTAPHESVLTGHFERLPSDTTSPDKSLSWTDVLHDILDSVPSGIIVFDKNDRYVLHNRAYTDIFPKLSPILKTGTHLLEMLAYGVEVGQYVHEIHPGSSREDRLRWVAEKAAQIRSTGPSREVLFGSDRWIQARERRSPNGYLVCLRTDITRLKRAEAEARRLAEQDDLTGLPNRRTLFEKLEACLHRRRKHDHGGAFALFDLDHFKDLNDTYGHHIGDQVLREIAHRATKIVRTGDIVARLGGDEFALLLPGLTSPQHAESFLGRFFDTLREPILVEHITIAPSISLGMVFFPVSHQTSALLYRLADHALYAAKQKGRNTWVLSAPPPDPPPHTSEYQ